jgi:hypothetical protein
MILVLFVSNFPCGHKSIETMHINATRDTSAWRTRGVVLKLGCSLNPLKAGSTQPNLSFFFSLLLLLFLVSLDIMVSMAFLLQQGGRPVEISGSL